MNKLPYQSKLDIAKYLDQPLRPLGDNIGLSKKKIQKSGYQQNLDQIIQRLNREKYKKKKYVQQLKKVNVQLPSDILLWNKIVKELRNYIRIRRHQDPLGMIIYRRRPNYFQHISPEFLQYLIQHPLSKKIHISIYRNDVLLFLNFIYQGRTAVAVVHIDLPNIELDNVREVLLQLLNIRISDYQILYHQNTNIIAYD
jgi:hypothetical protein